MANYTNLKAAIAAVIKQNGNQEITGDVMQTSLLNLISNVGMYDTFGGIVPDENFIPPVGADPNYFLLLTTPGTYAGFNDFVLNQGDVAMAYNRSNGWIVEKVNLASNSGIGQTSRGINFRALSRPAMLDNKLMFPGVDIATRILSGEIFNEYMYSNYGLFLDPNNPIKRLYANLSGAGQITIAIVDVENTQICHSVDVDVVDGLNYIDFATIGWDWSKAPKLVADVPDATQSFYVFFQNKTSKLKFATTDQVKTGTTCLEYHVGLGLIYGMNYDFAIAAIRGTQPISDTTQMGLSVYGDNVLPSIALAGNEVFTGFAQTGFAYCHTDMTVENWNERHKVVIYSWKQAKANIVYVSVKEETVKAQITVDLQPGYNEFESNGEYLQLSNVSFNELCYVMVEPITSFSIKYRNYAAITTKQRNQTTGEISQANVILQIGIIKPGKDVINTARQVNAGRQLIPLEPAVTPQNPYFYPTVRSSGGSYTYFNNLSWIRSDTRLAGVHVYAMEEGYMYIDFIQLNPKEGGGFNAIYLNPVTNNGFNVTAGWNYIPDTQLLFPQFDGIAYIGVRSPYGILGYNTDNGDGTNFLIEVNGTDNTAHWAPYFFSYFIDRYNYDIVAELASGKDIELPRGQIDITQKIHIESQKVKGAGITHTFLTNRITSGENKIVEIGHYGELSDVMVIGKTMGLSKESDYYNTADEIANETGMDMNAEYGVHIIGYGVRFTECMVVQCGCYGVLVEGQTTRRVHSFIANIQCFANFIGFKFLPHGEYNVMYGLAASNNILGLKIGAGNLFFSSCMFNDNRVGLHMYKSGNDAHGSFAACQFNHSQVYSMLLDAISHGETFVGCHVFEGDIYLRNSIGFNFNGGTIDANILAEGGKSQLVQGTSWQNAYWNRNNGIGHNYNGVTSYLRMVNNFFMFETGENDHIINTVTE